MFFYVKLEIYRFSRIVARLRFGIVPRIERIGKERAEGFPIKILNVKEPNKKSISSSDG